MGQTVHELRNNIRRSVGRFERELSAQFTKEELAAIASALGCEFDDGRPGKETMQAAIRERVGLTEKAGTFRKPELQTIAEALSEQ